MQIVLLTALLTLATASSSLASIKAPQVVRYELNCHIFPDGHKFKVDCTAALPIVDTARDFLSFELSNKMATPTVEILEPASLAGPVTPTKDHMDGDDQAYKLVLKSPVPSNAAVRLRFSYENTESKGFVFYLGPEGSFAGGPDLSWYPTFGDLRSEGVTTYTVPKPYVVAASGKSFPATDKGGDSEYRFEVDQPCHLTFAAGKYTVHRVEGGVPMTLYLLHDLPGSDEYVQGCWKVLQILQKEFGPYPFPEFALIETPTPISEDTGFSGASFEGFMFADTHSLARGFNLAYFGHEIGHQWWGNMVTRGGSHGANLLDEGMAQYGSLRVVETLEGPLAARQYRVDGYSNYSPVQCLRGSLLFQSGGYDLPLADMPSAYDAVYHGYGDAKGFLALHSIAVAIGYDKFSQAMKRITSKYAWGSVTLEQFEDEVVKAGGPGTRVLVDQWLHRTGTPVLTSSFVQKDGRLVVTLKQTEPNYRLKLPLEIKFADSSAKVREIELDKPEKTFEFDERAPVAAVTVDPDFMVYHATPEMMARAAALGTWATGYFLTYRGKNDDAEKALLNALKKVPSPDPYGVEYSVESTLGGIYFREGKLDLAKERYEKSLRCAVRDPATLPWTYLRLAQIARDQKDLEAMKSLLANAESADASLTSKSGAAFDITQMRGGS